MNGHTLAMHPGALGDLLLAVPALRALRAAEPGARLALAAQPRIGRLLVALGVADDAVAFDALGLGALFVDDPALAPADLVRGAGRVVCWFGARDPSFAARLRGLAPGAVVAPSVPAEGGAVWEHLLATVGVAAGDGVARGEGLAAPVTVPDSLLDAGRCALGAAGWDGVTPLLVVHPGASGPAKRWPAEGFARVLAPGAPAGRVVVLHEGPTDADAVDAVASRLKDVPLILRQPALEALAGALGLAGACLGNDSGVSHLAAAVGTPTLALFRQEHLAWRSWAPVGRAVVVARELVAGDVEATIEALGALLPRRAAA